MFSFSLSAPKQVDTSSSNRARSELNVKFLICSRSVLRAAPSARLLYCAPVPCPRAVPRAVLPCRPRTVSPCRARAPVPCTRAVSRCRAPVPFSRAVLRFGANRAPTVLRRACWRPCSVWRWDRMTRSQSKSWRNRPPRYVYSSVGYSAISVCHSKHEKRCRCGNGLNAFSFFSSRRINSYAT